MLIYTNHGDLVIGFNTFTGCFNFLLGAFLTNQWIELDLKVAQTQITLKLSQRRAIWSTHPIIEKEWPQMKCEPKIVEKVKRMFVFFRSPTLLCLLACSEMIEFSRLRRKGSGKLNISPNEIGVGQKAASYTGNTLPKMGTNPWRKLTVRSSDFNDAKIVCSSNVLV